jgi:hypothetical protein
MSPFGLWKVWIVSSELNVVQTLLHTDAPMFQFPTSSFTNKPMSWASSTDRRMLMNKSPRRVHFINSSTLEWSYVADVLTSDPQTIVFAGGDRRRRGALISHSWLVARAWVTVRDDDRDASARRYATSERFPRRFCSLMLYDVQVVSSRRSRRIS